MATITKKISDNRHGAEFQLSGNAAEVAATVRINPELLYGARVELTIPTGAPLYQVGERVTQTSGGIGYVVRHDPVAGELVLMTDRNTTAIFNTTDNVVGDTSGANHNPSAKTAVPYILQVEKVNWNTGGSAATETVSLLWDATVDETILQMYGRGDGTFIPDGMKMDPGVIAGQTGSINTITSGTFVGTYTILIRTIKETGFVFPIE